MPMKPGSTENLLLRLDPELAGHLHTVATSRAAPSPMSCARPSPRWSEQRRSDKRFLRLLQDNLARHWQALEDMIRRMQPIPGGWARHDSWSLVQNSYLQLVETLEEALRSWFEDDDDAVAGLYGEHFKLIREMTASTPRPSPLLDDETARQVRVLERLRAKVQALEALRAREGQIAVLDTNVLMRYQGRADPRYSWKKILARRTCLQTTD
jgi:hypothetical protein